MTTLDEMYAAFIGLCGVPCQSLNADLFVFQEIAGPSADGRYEGALDEVARQLTARGAGHYVVFYTQAGGEQRVAMMWDRDWLRAKGEVTDLFPRGTHMMPGGPGERPRDAFAGRTPLYGHFTARVPSESSELERTSENFEFQVLGVHLKAMGDGHPQRLKSSEVLVDWYRNDAMAVDSDVLIMGDFNAPPSEERSFKPFWDLEASGEAGFRSLNDESDFSYMWLRNQTDKFVSRIDLTVASLSSQKRAEKLAQPIRWKPIEETLAVAGNLKDTKVREVLHAIKENLSDHLPCVSRFYFGPPSRKDR
jgi:hypothetical protein